jgi:uncharacterized SAM-binding protein YcdF (DUF218 family)
VAVRPESDPRPEVLRLAAVGMAVGATAGFFLRDLAVESFASLWLPAALAGALLWITPLRRLLAFGTLGLGALWLMAAFTPLTAQFAAGLVRRDPVRQADAVLVLSSRLQADGDPTSPALSRLLHGLELLGEGWAPRLIVTELPPPAPSYAAVARIMMHNLGLEREVLAVGPVTRTRDEAVLVAALYREKGWNRLLLVTSPTHSARASATFEHEGMVVVSSPGVETQFDLETLDRPVERLLAFRTVLHERLGFWLYERNGWIAAMGVH